MSNLDPHSARFVHELSNLVDGSMRQLSQALAKITVQSSHESPAVQGEVIQQLQAADGGMKQLALMVRQWMSACQQQAAYQSASHDLGQMIEHAVSLMRTASLSRGVRVRVRLTEAVKRLPAGPIYTIVTNALRNSIEAIESPGGHIAIFGRVIRDDVIILVCDDGPGLSSHLLDPQGQFSFGRTTKPSGHGLGLVLSKQLAERLEGELILTNRRRKGARLSLRFPKQSLFDPPTESWAPANDQDVDQDVDQGCEQEPSSRRMEADNQSDAAWTEGGS